MAATTETTSQTTTTKRTAPPVRLLGSGPRRWRWLGLGVGLMVAGALGATWAWGQADQREGVVVAAHDLPAGHTLAPEDVTVAQVAAGDEVAAISSQDLQDTVGQTLAVPLDEGMLLADGALAEAGEYPEAGQAIVGAALEPTQYPASLQPGAHVSVVAAAGGEQAEETADGTGGVVDPVDAQVQSITPAEDGGATLVELAVDSAEAEAVARAASAGEVALVRTAEGGS